MNKPSRGFLTIAENNNVSDFVEMAYILALSLNASQSKIKKLSIIVSDIDTVKYEYRNVFDKIILVDSDIDWKEKSKSNDTTSLCAGYYDVTPYDETIALDADMIFPQDINDWWEILSAEDLVFSTNVKTFRNKPTGGDYYRKVYTENNLPNLYTGVFYFKKSDKAKLFFDTVNIVFNNWESFFQDLKEENRPTFLSADVAYAITYKLLGFSDYSYLNVPTFVHMKTRLQDITQKKEEWTEFINVSLNSKLELSINNFIQKYPFHYHDKNFLTKDLIEKYKRY